jgi:methylmalonyl-CoA mutase cobalamin-binding domain/chain
MDSAIRVLLTKSFIDSHDRAIKVIAVALRDAGMEVILVDYETPEDIIDMAVDEGVDIIGISFMSGGQVQVTEEAMRLLQEGGHDLPVVVGGTVRPFDVPALEAAGVKAIFRGGEKMEAVIGRFTELALEKRRVTGGL